MKAIELIGNTPVVQIPDTNGYVKKALSLLVKL